VLDAAAVASQPTVGRKRGRDDGTLVCGDLVKLAPGTEVVLEPTLGYKQESPDRLTADDAGAVDWVFSGLEPGPDGTESVHVMSMPCRIGATSYALYHFTGHVPKSSVSKCAAQFGL